VIRRTLDADFMIFDVSGRNGGGLLVNGRPLSSARLAHGDRIVLGATALVFHRFQGPVPA
jgi:pSer/pThr/pTyr-binding forkhead associated (FHA) protein